MTTASNDRRSGPYTATAGQTEFIFDFPIDAAADLEVWKKDFATKTVSKLEEGAGNDYTVALNGEAPSEGTITLSASSAAGDIIVIEGQRTAARTSDFSPGGDFFARVVNTGEDRQFWILQEILRDVSRCIRVNVVDEVIATELSTIESRANTRLGFDEVGAVAYFEPTDESANTATAIGGDTSLTHASRFSQQLTVKDFGATGNGTIDDTTALQAAITAAAGKQLIVPAGTYIVSGLTVSSTMKILLLEGATIKLAGGANAHLITISADNVSIEGGTLDGNKANQTGTSKVIVATAADNIVLEDIQIVNGRNRGIELQNCNNPTVRNCNVSAIDASGIYLYAGSAAITEFTIEGNDVDLSANSTTDITGIAISNISTGLVLKNGRVSGNTVIMASSPSGSQLGIELFGDAAALSIADCVVNDNVVTGGTIGISFGGTLACRSCVIGGNSVFGPTTIGIEAGGYNNAVSGNTVHGNGITNSGISINTADAVYNQVSGNNIYNTDNAGIYVNGDATDNSITSNTVVIASGTAIDINGADNQNISGNFLKGPGSGSASGIRLTASSNISMTGNLITSFQDLIGIVVQAAVTVDYYAITGNVFADYTNPINKTLSGGGAIGLHVKVKGNVGESSSFPTDWWDYANNRRTSHNAAAPNGILGGGLCSEFFQTSAAAGYQKWLKTVGTDSYGWRPVATVSSHIVRLYDDFLGDAIADQWGAQVGSDPQVVAPAYNAQSCGAMRMTTGDDAAANMATNGVQLEQALVWKAANGNLVFEGRIKMDAITNVSIFMGLTDQVGSLEIPIQSAASADTITTNATDAVGVMFDTAMATDNWWLVGVANNVDATPQDSGSAPVAGTYQTWRIEVATSGTAKFFLNGALVGSSMSGAVTASVLLTPVVAAFSLGAASRNIDTDFIDVSMARG